MKPNELDGMRALIRARHGLPEPPRPSLPQAICIPSPPRLTASEASPPDDAQPAAPKKRSTFGLAVACAPESEPQASASPTLAVGPVSLDAAPPSKASPWSPDASLHRLVELLMQMQALVEVPSPCSPLAAGQPEAIQARRLAA